VQINIVVAAMFMRTRRKRIICLQARRRKSSEENTKVKERRSRSWLLKYLLVKSVVKACSVWRATPFVRLNQEESTPTKVPPGEFH
jgi:hypothetical protein